MNKGIKLEILITQDILNRSANCISNVGQNCAIGLAIFEIFGHRSNVDSHEIVILNQNLYEGDLILKSKLMAQIPLPNKAQEFIDEFDKSLPHQRKLMTPFSFEIEIPENVIEMINIDEIYKVLETSTCLKLVEV